MASTFETGIADQGSERTYTNYFQVGHNRGEFLVDLGCLDPDAGAVRLHSRLVISPVYAKYLKDLLDRSVMQYEGECGEIPVVE